MEALTHIQKSPLEVDFYFEETLIVQVINKSVVFTPASADIINNWKHRQMEGLADYVAPFIGKMMEYGKG